MTRPHKTKSVTEDSTHSSSSVDLDFAALPFTSTEFALVVRNHEPDGVLHLCFTLYTCSHRVMSAHANANLNLNPALAFTLK